MPQRQDMAANDFLPNCFSSYPCAAALLVFCVGGMNKRWCMVGVEGKGTVVLLRYCVFSWYGQVNAH